MNWSLNGIRIFTQEDTLESTQTIPRLQPLAGGTTLQIFGWESPIKTITAIVIGYADMADLLSLAQDGVSHILQSPEGSMGSFFVQKVGYKRKSSICQTLRPDLPANSIVYDVSLTLYEDE